MLTKPSRWQLFTIRSCAATAVCAACPTQAQVPASHDTPTMLYGAPVALVLLVAFLVIAVPFVVAGRRRELSWPAVFTMSALIATIIVLVPSGLALVTRGRGAVAETLPWTMLAAAVIAALWLFTRTRSRRAPTRRSKNSKPPGRNNAPATESSAPASSAVTIFLSYRRNDSADATGRLYDRLTSEFGHENVFKDVDNIPLGVDFRDHISRVVGTTDVVLAVIGPGWLDARDADNNRRLDDAGDPVHLEIAAALGRNIPVVPVLVGGAEIPGDQALPKDIVALAYRNGTRVRPDPDFHHDVDRLIAGLRTTAKQLRS